MLVCRVTGVPSCVCSFDVQVDTSASATAAYDAEDALVDLLVRVDACPIHTFTFVVNRIL